MTPLRETEPDKGVAVIVGVRVTSGVGVGVSVKAGVSVSEYSALVVARMDSKSSVCAG